MKKLARSKTLRIIFLILLVCSTLSAGWLYYETNPNVIFIRLSKNMIEEHPEFYSPKPFEGEAFPIIHSGKLKKEEQYFKNYQAQLKEINRAQLKDKNKAAYIKLEQKIKERLTLLHKMKTDPSLYNLGGELKIILSSDSIALDARLLRIGQGMKEAAIYYMSAKNNLNQPDPEKTTLAIQKQLLSIKFLNGELLDSLARSSLSAQEKEAFIARTYEAKIAIKDYLAFCRSLLFEQRDSIFVK
ncbi:MAG: hypothetical protein IPJ74_17110 [Saprospiraceae bacterium]|nr:hypothetical protein [Saprospiraceae bacterium]